MLYWFLFVCSFVFSFDPSKSLILTHKSVLSYVNLFSRLTISCTQAIKFRPLAAFSLSAFQLALWGYKRFLGTVQFRKHPIIPQLLLSMVHNFKFPQHHKFLNTLYASCSKIQLVILL